MCANLPIRICLSPHAPYAVSRVYLGSGGFGQVMLGRREGGAEEDDDPPEVALKFEPLSRMHASEDDAYRALSGIPGIPRVYFSMDVDGYHVTAMEKLDILRGKRASDEVASIAQQLLLVMKAFHDEGYVHGDIKPDNMGMRVSNRQMCVIDLGLAQKIGNNPHAGFRGTVVFASINAHQRGPPSRRDDLESLFYSLIFMVSGSLPWGKNPSEPDVGSRKMSTSPSKLTCRLKDPSIRASLRAFGDDVNALRIGDLPDYGRMAAHFDIRASSPTSVLRKRARDEPV